MSAEKPWYGSWTEGVPKTLDYPEIPLFSLLSRAAEKWPDSTAFSCGEERLSYRELDELSDRLATGLDGLGIKSGDRVLLFLGNSLEFVISYYGILKAGGTVATVNPLSRQAELRHQLIDTAATAIISGSQFYPLVKEVKDGTELKVIILTDTKSSEEWTSLKQILESNPAKPPHISIRPRDDVAAIVYTGGTTGLAKGVLLTHYNLLED